MSDTYTKLFRSIAASTIVSEPLATRWLWVTLLSQADRQGRVYGSIPGLARMANITMAEVHAALDCFMAPDTYSRTSDHEGRRVAAIDGGWVLLNHAKYDAMRNEAERREAKREWDRKHRPSGHQRAKKTESDSPTTVRQSDEKSDHSPPESDASPLGSDGPTPCLMSHVSQKLEDANASLSSAAPQDEHQRHDDSGEQPDGRPPCPHVRIIALYHEALPELRQVREWNETRRRLLQRRWAESPERQTIDWWREFFRYVRDSRFLMGKTSGKDGRSFDCDLEWLIRPTNFAKVVEGKYEDQVA